MANRRKKGYTSIPALLEHIKAQDSMVVRFTEIPVRFDEQIERSRRIANRARVLTALRHFGFSVVQTTRELEAATQLLTITDQLRKARNNLPGAQPAAAGDGELSLTCRSLEGDA